MYSHVLHRDDFVEAMRSASIPAEVDPSLRNFVGRERAWKDYWTHTCECIYEAQPGLDSIWIRCQDTTDYLERVLHIIQRFRHTREPRNPRPSLVPFACPYDRITVFHARAHERDFVFAEH